MNSIKDKACITGIGETTYSKCSGMSTTALILQASTRAISDAGLKNGDIDGVVAPFLGASSYELGASLGIRDLKWAVTVQMGGASSVAAIMNAAMAVATGVCRHVLVPTGWNGYSGTRVSKDMATGPELTLPMADRSRDYEYPYGCFVPAQWYSPICLRHMHIYGTTHDHLGAISVTMRQHAQFNSNSQMKGKPITLEDYHKSRWVSYPYHLLDCCLETDGAAACVVSSAEAARDMPNVPVSIIGAATGHSYPADDIANRPDMFHIGLTDAAPRALRMAGVTPQDMDFAMIYDCFTFEVLHQIEAIGFCGEGEGGPWLDGGRRISWPDGELPINTHGGLLSQGHVIGMNHACEAVKQLRGTSEAQVKNAQLGLVTGWGDYGDGSIIIVRRV